MKTWLIAVGLVVLGCGGEADETLEDLTEPTCALEGDYVVKNLPMPGCGIPNEFPARVELRQVECDTPVQHCEPGVPSARCEFTRQLTDTCSTHVIWEQSTPPR